jgi:hypothetical protein
VLPPPELLPEPPPLYERLLLELPLYERLLLDDDGRYELLDDEVLPRLVEVVL